MARDLIHEIVKQAIINDGWEITDDPLRIELVGDARTLEAGLGAEKLIAAEKEKEKIAVEVKTLGGGSLLNGFHTVLGQYLDYRDAILEADMKRELYIALSNNIYSELLEISFIKRRINQYAIKFIVVNFKTIHFLKMPPLAAG